MKLCLNCESRFPASELHCPACGYAPRSEDGLVQHAPQMIEPGQGFRPEHFDELAQLESANFWFKARNQLIIDAIHANFSEPRNFLEIGCGTGFVLSGLSQAFPNSKLYGSELFVEGLRHAARRLPHAQLMQMDARKIPYCDEFDLIGAFDVVEHIAEDQDVLAAMHRAIVPGGGVILTVPQHPMLWSAQDEYACHVRRYRRGELEAKLVKAGFRVVFSTSFVSLLLPLMLMARLSKQKLRQDYDASSELKIHPAVNSALYSVMRLERRLIRFGIRFPAGGTRLVCAIKDQ